VRLLQRAAVWRATINRRRDAHCISGLRQASPGHAQAWLVREVLIQVVQRRLCRRAQAGYGPAPNLKRVDCPHQSPRKRAFCYGDSSKVAWWVVSRPVPWCHFPLWPQKQANFGCRFPLRPAGAKPLAWTLHNVEVQKFGRKF
jgi:hypothetical protein